MNKYNSVPKLDLAPKLKRPLSLWNPLDYLRLLYWMLFFPQALRWYLDKFGGGYVSPDPKNTNWRKRWQTDYQSTVQFTLLIQGFIIVISIPIAIAICRSANFPISVAWINKFDVSFSIWFTIIYMGVFNARGRGLPKTIAQALPMAIFVGILDSSLITSTGINRESALVVGLTVGLLDHSYAGLISGILPRTIHILIPGIVTILSYVVAVSIVILEKINLLMTTNTIITCLVCGLAMQIMVLRPDCWLLSFPTSAIALIWRRSIYFS